MYPMLKIVVACLLLATPLAAEAVTTPVDVDMNFRLTEAVSPTRSSSSSTADHTAFEALQGPFDSGPEVTRACLSCHTEAGGQFMRSIHWRWEGTDAVTGQLLGKRNLVNTFCTNARGNEGMCAQCHASYGWAEEDFGAEGMKWEQTVDAGREENIDCLVCHDRTGGYYKAPLTKGNEACSTMFQAKPPIDLAEVARKVGNPGRENCGACHFYGGGGDGVKHGDLDSSLVRPDHALDVHMDASGADFACTACHVSDQHTIAGSHYHLAARDTDGTGKPGQPRGAASCESCHGLSPHPNRSVAGIKLNDHVARVACQTCHIPALARGGVATITAWDWRTAGRTRNGEGYKENSYTQGNGEQRATYKSIKGNFEYGENLQPHYAWFDGRLRHTTIDTRFDPQKTPIEVNGVVGSADDLDSRIWPFKRMRTVQPFDSKSNTLVYMRLWGDDDEAYWGNYDFGRAIKAGMAGGGLPYSGEYGFIETVSYWPSTHMVAPKEDALACGECHAGDGRLDSVGGFYLPGRDGRWLDRIGLLLVGGALLGVFGHALLRLFSSAGRKVS